MNTLNLIFPMAFYVFYIVAIGIYNFLTRYHGVRSGEISFKYFRAYQGDIPDRAIIVARHYDNQFDLPLLFFISCAIHMIIGRSDTWTLTFAWLFVASRLVHSYIHLGKNDVRLRALAFFFGWFMILAMWIQLLWTAAIR